VTDLGLDPRAPVLQMADLAGHRSARTVRDAVATACMGLAVVVVALPLALVLFTVISKGAGVISWRFLTSDIPFQARSRGGGMGPAVVGTIVITLVASLLAVPLGILGAVYLHEYGGTSRYARLVRFMSTVMTGVPSIVMGLFIFTIWVIPRKGHGLSAFSGALALACLMLPIVIRSTEEMLKLVPTYLREASLGLGSTKARAIATVVLPAAVPGIVSGCLLAVARAAGETAPLLFTIGAVNKANPNPFRGPTTALSAQIYSNANSPFAGAQGRAYGAAITLVALAFLLTLAARLVTARIARKR
jgi:phosphate transport system permease protein